ncbi:MAG: Ig-like domain-containing protein [Anaerolineae bacterium]
MIHPFNKQRANRLLLVVSFLIVTMLLGAGKATARSHASAAFPLDLDVTYIERTPRYPRFLSCSAGNPRVDYPCPSPIKHYPDSGEIVTFTAHVMNKGTNAVGQFDYTWSVDGVSIKQGTHTWASTGDQTESLQWTWHSGAHRVKFAITSPADSLAGNNSREERTDAYALSIFVEQGQYDALQAQPNLIGSYSFEDWIQAQLARMNLAFADAVYPTTPNGAISRVRIDKIAAAPEMDAATPNAFRLDPDEFLQDGRWLFSDGDPTNNNGNGGFYASYAGSFANAYDWGLLHELGHQVGRIDMYNIDFNPNHNLITGPNGQPLLIGHLAAYGYGKDMMEDPGSGKWSEFHAASFNRDYGDRAGLFGSYLFDLPAANELRLVDSNGQAVGGAGVSVYHDQNDSLTDASLVLRGTTDGDGRFSLGADPFGTIDHGGINATLFISATVSGNTEYHWLELTAFNLAFWRGHQDQATYTVTLGQPDNSDLTLPPVLAPDTTPPTVSLIAPTNGSALSGMVMLSASAQDDRGIKRVELIADGRPIYVFPRLPYSVLWDTALLMNGNHQLWVRVYDTALPANVGDSPRITVTTQNSEQHLYSWDFNVDNDFEGWDVGWQDVPPPSVSGGTLRLTPPTGDPGMRRWLPFGVTALASQILDVRMRVSAGGAGVGQFYWTTYADQQEDEKKVVYFTAYGDNVWHEYRIPVGQSAAWQDRIRTIRFDPVHGDQYIGSNIEIDWIRLPDQPRLYLPLIVK